MCVLLCHIGNWLIKDGCMAERSPPAARESLTAWRYSSHIPVVKRVISGGGFFQPKAICNTLVCPLIAGNIPLKEPHTGHWHDVRGEADYMIILISSAKQDIQHHPVSISVPYHIVHNITGINFNMMVGGKYLM